MRYLVLIITLLGSSVAADHAIACNSNQTTVQTAINAAAPGDTVTFATNNGSQCVYNMTGLTLPVLTITHPTAEAKLHTTISGGAVNAILIDSGGTAYTIAPSITIIGGGGKEATGHCTISGGSVNACVVDSGGSGYLGTPQAVAISIENYVTIQSDNVANLPTSGRRITTANITNKATTFPKLVSTNNANNLFRLAASSGSQTFDGGSYWKIVGLELTDNNPASVGAVLVALNNGSHLVVDRNYIHPGACPNNSAPYNSSGVQAINADSYDVTIQGNYFDCWWGIPPGSSAGATANVTVSVGVGTIGNAILIDNNYLTGWFNPIYFGGADPLPSAAGAATISGSPSFSAIPVTGPTTGLTAGMPVGIQLPINSPTVNISSIARSGNVVTVVTSTSHLMSTGASATIASVTGGTTSFNGLFGPITKISGTSFSYAQTGANESGSGGTSNPFYCERPSPQTCWGSAIVSSVVGGTVNLSTTIRSLANLPTGLFSVPDISVASTGATPLVGGQLTWAGPQVSNIDVTRNYAYTDTGFATWQQTNNGNHPKTTLVETKMLNGGRFEGNVADGYPGPMFGQTCTQQYGYAPWETCSNITFASNWSRQSVFNVISGAEGYIYNTAGNAWVVTNNLWDTWDQQGAFQPGSQYDPLVWAQGFDNVNTVTVTHNTNTGGFNTPSSSCTGQPTPPNANGDCYTKSQFVLNEFATTPTDLVKPAITFRDNLMPMGNYGVQCGSALVVSSCWTLTEDHNITVANVLSSQWGPGGNGNQNPWANSNGGGTTAPACSGHAWPGCYADSWAFVKMKAPNSGDYTLSSSSIGYRTASDGTDVGFNVATMNSALGPDNPQVPGGSGISSFSGTVVFGGTVVIQ